MLDPNPREDRAKALEQCTHEGFVEILGSSGSQAIMYHIGGPASLKDPATLHARLAALFGPIGAESLEKKIVKRLYDSLGRPPPMRDSDGGPKFDFESECRALLGDGVVTNE